MKREIKPFGPFEDPATCQHEWEQHLWEPLSLYCPYCATLKVKKTTPKKDEIRVVRGGYGLMKVLTYEASTNTVEMLGHGPNRDHGFWFTADRLGEPVDREVILKERKEAVARKVGCNSPDCWCRKY